MSEIKIVVVGGGAGGLELATKLGRRLGKKGRAEITLVDRKRTHIWKPLLHEVAAGSLDDGVDALSYRAHARNHHFQFQLGALSRIERDSKQIVLAPMNDEKGEELMAERTLDYDYLVISLGSVSNDFNTQGVRDNCIFLDSPEQARRFHRELLNAFLKVGGGKNETLDIAIVGAGATGVELSAELHKAAEEAALYGVKDAGRDKLNVTLVEAGPRILPALPERISGAAHKELLDLGVAVKTATMVTEATSSGLKTKDGDEIPAQLMVWAAGIKAPDFLAEIGGLETNRINQLVVKSTLQTTNDDSIYALGDCASCIQEDGKPVPPRAQAAHQMASHVYKNLLAQLEGKPLTAYEYKDHGSLVSLSKYTTVGSLMGNLTRGSMRVEGRVARFVYISLYRMHQFALHGWFKTLLLLLVGQINRALRPTLKLH
ncbi:MULTISPECIES: NAD(P)/FAD-dependent oxidoreductase [Corallincola]|uniref:NAD(P)/FAD-dependent oxidoreductase n=3 Tax=Corallincola TaxID=1775176 RepID=A0A368NSA9_9GAMM|nr:MULTISPECIES: NAD(P)/FAD-dependent oxidoreductase [Corallincola]RCU52574.1 NAD(P)/FAD-dependent oxidoreductase [Corallincola holothuriorum]TAA48234.1 NAD(P)/FAD-dependent oxidoreductase [Corallincola spongiicola]TCI02472.1 NAD(P)/FAD-dependent oxidoreductase [Corallincola luteus]